MTLLFFCRKKPSSEKYSTNSNSLPHRSMLTDS